jgi:hypothetical protein
MSATQAATPKTVRSNRLVGLDIWTFMTVETVSTYTG